MKLMMKMAAKERRKTQDFGDIIGLSGQPSLASHLP